MRASNHKGRTTKSGQAYNVNHNDRNFESETDKHIDKDRISDNIYLTVDTQGEISELQGTFREHERKMYAELYADSLYSKNEKRIAQGHGGDVKGIDDYLDGKRTCPEEEILQVGKEGEFWDVEKFRACVEDYIKEHQKLYPDIKIMDAAIHCDETSLHCHLRKTYTAPDKDGNLEAKQHKCLENLGFKLPDPEQKRGRHNNLKIPYTEKTRELWLDICDRNLEMKLEREPDKGNLGLDLAEYKRQQEIERLKETESQSLEARRTLEAQNEEIKGNNGMINYLKEMIENLTRQIESYKAKIKELIERHTKIQAEKEKAENELLNAKKELSQTQTEKTELEKQVEVLQRENKKLLEEANRMPAKEIEGKKALGGGIKLSEEEFAALKSKAKAYDKNKNKIAKGDSYIKQAKEIKNTAEVEAKAIVKNSKDFMAGLNNRVQNAKAEDKAAEAKASLDFAEKFIDALGAGARYRAAINAKRAEKMTAVKEVDELIR